MTSKKKALVVLSGGQDSVTCLFWAIEQGYQVHAITFDYGQVHSIEIESARNVFGLARNLVQDQKDIPGGHFIIEVPEVLQSVSPLLDRSAVLERYADAYEMEQIIGNRVEKTFVPMRNTFFLTVAANYAVALAADVLITGICGADNANYPDCTDAFRQRMEELINESLGYPVAKTFGDKNRFEVLAPLMFLTKAQTCMLGKKLPGCWEALAYSHTSYDGKYPPTDMNHSNVLRAAGFEEAGLPDPLVIRACREGLMPVPETANYAGLQDDINLMKM